MTAQSSLPIDVERVSALIREVAQSEIMPYFRDLANAGVRQKTGPMDLVTLADEAAERVLTPLLTDLLPGSTVVGEEAVSKDESLLDRLHGDAPVWIIDPVDGTLNFANGRPLFAVIVALVRTGETLAGWIHDPNDGRMVTATKGGGAFLDGRPVRVAPAVPLDRMAGAASVRFCDAATGARIEAGLKGMGEMTSLSSAAQEYMRLLDGRFHYALYHRLMPWDHAAGVLMHAEAGGHAALSDGRPYGPAVVTGGASLLMAPDEASWQALRRQLLG